MGREKCHARIHTCGADSTQKGLQDGIFGDMERSSHLNAECHDVGLERGLQQEPNRVGP